MARYGAKMLAHIFLIKLYVCSLDEKLPPSCIASRALTTGFNNT
jgi:hypothetical protein